MGTWPEPPRGQQLWGRQCQGTLSPGHTGSRGGGFWCRSPPAPPQLRWDNSQRGRAGARCRGGTAHGYLPSEGPGAIKICSKQSLPFPGTFQKKRTKTPNNNKRTKKEQSFPSAAAYPRVAFSCPHIFPAQGLPAAGGPHRPRPILGAGGDLSCCELAREQPCSDLQDRASKTPVGHPGAVTRMNPAHRDGAGVLGTLMQPHFHVSPLSPCTSPQLSPALSDFDNDTPFPDFSW